MFLLKTAPPDNVPSVYRGTPPGGTKRRYQFDHTADAFLSTPLWGQVCTELINKIETMEATQANFDNAYADLCKAIFKEMDEHIKYKECGKTMRKTFKNFKPYWSDELTTLWRDMATAERSFRKCSSSGGHRQLLREHFKQKQVTFDKAQRKVERSYNRAFADNIEKINTSDPKHFWEHIEKLGPKKTTEIPLKVHCDPDGFSDNLNVVLGTWRSEFVGLYNIPDSDDLNFDD